MRWLPVKHAAPSDSVLMLPVQLPLCSEI